ncbi:MAG: hypothetical protein ABIJ09_19090 [Pseudomonadota bacterium]
MRVLMCSVVLGVVLATGCSFQAQQCCDCMATKSTVFGECMKDTMDSCVDELSKSPPNVDAISPLCRDEENFCPDSCADVLYKK